MSKEKQQNQAGINNIGGASEAGTDSVNIKEDLKDNQQTDSRIDIQDDFKKELENVKGNLEEKTKQCTEYLDKLQRAAAEFENFKRRTAREKETIYIDAVSDVVSAFLPVLDNVERALSAMPEDNASKSLKDGVEMVFKQFKETFKNLGVEEIKAVNEQFDPVLHNAVMHVDDEELDHNIVVEEFQKGYIYKDRVIRYSMVKVAN